MQIMLGPHKFNSVVGQWMDIIAIVGRRVFFRNNIWPIMWGHQRRTQRQPGGEDGLIGRNKVCLQLRITFFPLDIYVGHPFLIGLSIRDGCWWMNIIFIFNENFGLPMKLRGVISSGCRCRQRGLCNVVCSVLQILRISSVVSRLSSPNAMADGRRTSFGRIRKAVLVVP